MGRLIGLVLLVATGCEASASEEKPATPALPKTVLVSVGIESEKRHDLSTFATAEECAKSARNLNAGAKESGSPWRHECVAPIEVAQ